MVDDAVRRPDPASPSPKRTGRPTGSVSLTPEIQEHILALIRAGTFSYVAAESAGVPDRTFFEWLQRGESKHPSRPPTPELVEFARQVRIARAQARAAAEIRVYRENPRYWLSHVARSKPEQEGWTELIEPPEERSSGQRLAELIRQLDDEGSHEASLSRTTPEASRHEVPPRPDQER